jgi:hypothetical protein
MRKHPLIPSLPTLALAFVLIQVIPGSAEASYPASGGSVPAVQNSADSGINPCGVLLADYPNIAANPGDGFVLPPSFTYSNFSGNSSAVTDGQVVALFNVVCNYADFEQLFSAWGGTNFTLGGGEISTTPTVSFGFRWEANCSGVIEPNCIFYEFWTGYPESGIVQGPVRESSSLLNSSSASDNSSGPLPSQEGGPTLTTPAFLAVVVLPIAVVTAVSLWWILARRRKRRAAP